MESWLQHQFDGTLAFAEGNGDWHLELRASFQHMLEEKREGKEEGRKEDNEE